MHDKIIILLLLFFFFKVGGQNSAAAKDSLLEVFYHPPKGISEQNWLKAANEIISYYSMVQLDSIPVIVSEMQQIGQKKGRTIWQHQALHWMGYYYYLIGNNAAAKEQLQQLTQKAGKNDSLQVYAYATLGLVYNKEHQLDSALWCYQYAVQIAEQNFPVNNFKDLFYVQYYDMAEIYEKKGMYVDALEHYQIGKAGISILRKRYGAVKMANIYKKLGLLDEARASFEEAKSYPANQTRPANYIRSLCLLMDAAPDLFRVKELLDEGLLLTEKYNLPLQKIHLNMSAGKVYVDSQYLTLARQCMERVRWLSDTLQSETTRIESLLYLSKIDMLEGAHTRALQSARSIQPAIEKNNSLYEMIILYEVLSACYEALGRPDSALFYLKKKWAADARLNDREALKKSISAYLKYKNKQEQAALEAAKTYAENMAQVTQSRLQLLISFSILLVILFVGVILLYNYFYRQKEKLVKSLANSNATLQAEQTALRAANQKLSRFGSVISHDVLSNLDLMLTAGNVYAANHQWPGPAGQYYDLTQNTIRRLKQYCIGLLDQLKTAKSAQQPLEDPMPVLQQVLKSFGLALRNKGFEVEVQPLSPARLPVVVMEQLFQNIISNAIKYAATAPQPRLWIGEGQSGEWFIMDNGPGIAPDRLNTLMDQPGNPSETGQGLGLYLLKQALQTYGAEIRIEHRPEGGSHFIITPPDRR